MAAGSEELVSQVGWSGALGLSQTLLIDDSRCCGDPLSEGTICWKTSFSPTGKLQGAQRQI